MRLLRRPINASDRILDRFCVISMEFLSLSRKRSSSRNVPQRRWARRNVCSLQAKAACKRIQHCCATLRRSRNKRNVGSCWLKRLTGFKLFATTRNNLTSNNMQQGVQTDATCNIQQCWELLANNTASVCTGLNTDVDNRERAEARHKIQKRRVSLKEKPENVILAERLSSGHQGKNERQWKKKKADRNTCYISSIKRVTRKFLEISIKIYKNMCCTCNDVSFSLIRPFVFVFYVLPFSLPSPFSITEF